MHSAATSFGATSSRPTISRPASPSPGAARWTTTWFTGRAHARPGDAAPGAKRPRRAFDRGRCPVRRSGARRLPREGGSPALETWVCELPDGPVWRRKPELKRLARTPPPAGISTPVNGSDQQRIERWPGCRRQKCNDARRGISDGSGPRRRGVRRTRPALAAKRHGRVCVAMM